MYEGSIKSTDLPVAGRSNEHGYRWYCDEYSGLFY